MIDNQKAARRAAMVENLPAIVERLNTYLSGGHLDSIEPVLQRLGRGGKLPHWFDLLKSDHVLPNLDGKTVGSVVEMLLVADLEKHVLKEDIQLRINPASGVDLPDLDLGIKSPSENWCTSEPFTHAYERILGSEYEVLALITNYQTAKKTPPLKLQIIASGYLTRSEVADQGLCQRARALRGALGAIEETSAQKAFRFLAYANQSDWLCKALVRCFDLIADEDSLRKSLEDALSRFPGDAKRSKAGLNPAYEEKIARALGEKPLWKAVISLADDWVIEAWRNTAQMPSHSDWERFQLSPLDGKLGVSFALQWRYNFGVLFKALGQCSTEDLLDGLAV